MDVPVSALDELFDTYLVVQARITANLEAHAATLSLNASQLLVVRDVLDHPGTSLKDVCQRCGLKKSAASRLIDALASRKMIIRDECPTSRRAVSLHLGPALGDGQFCRVTALTKALPGWSGKETVPDYQALKAGLEAFLQLTVPPSRS
jgi:DNA-binding MarR family transcriptional regulator